MDSLVWLLKEYLQTKYGLLPVIGHKDVMATACPGRNFPWDELRKRLEGSTVSWKEKLMQDAAKAGLIDGNHGHKPDEPATKWFVLAVAINLLKVVKGGK